jgi:uncharacterized membrane protein
MQNPPALRDIRHPMLIAIPVGLWIFSFVTTVVYFSDASETGVRGS